MNRNPNGSGYIIKTDNGKYRMRKQSGFLPNGRPRILTVTSPTKQGCRTKMCERENNITSSDNVKLWSDTTLTELCRLHLNEHLNEVDRLKPKAADRRESTINNQIAPYAIGRLQVEAVNSTDIKNHIEALIKEQKLSVSSITKTLDVINSAYKWANNQGHLNQNPCKSVLESLKNRLKNLNTKYSSKGMVIVLSDEQIKVLTEGVNSLVDDKNAETYKKLYALSLLLLLHTGMRVGELCSLRWNSWDKTANTLDINSTRNVVKNRLQKNNKRYIAQENVVKNYHSRTIELTPQAQDILNKLYSVTHYKSSDDYIILNRIFKPTVPTNMDRFIKNFYKELGFTKDISGAHILRRTFATQRHNEKWLTEDIAAYLGDTTETIRKHYISLTKKIVSDGRVLNVVKLPTKA